MPSTTSRAPFTRFTTPGGKPTSSSISNTSFCDSGTRSLGLTTNVLPSTTACGRNQSGTMAGKLNGVIAANTPMRLADRLAVDAGRDVLEGGALHGGGDGARLVDVVDRAPHAAARLVERLAVLHA